MTVPPPPFPTRGLALVFARRRVRVTLLASLLWALLLSLPWQSSLAGLLLRTLLIGFAALFAFGLFEQWPKRVPRGVARWVLQVAAVALTLPLAVLLIYIVTTGPGEPPWYRDQMRLIGFALLSLSGLLIAPWIAMSALLQQRDGTVRSQAQAFALQRSELQRDAVEARLRLLQAQVEPHFLFNTLANVRELVDTGSPQASAVLGSLIAYLRAAMPRLQDTATTLAQEVDLVRAYLELMQMRFPDRLQYAIDVQPAALALRCPPLTLLTLVENAVRHGIDPAEEGGRIDVRVALAAGRCRLQVSDTGVGLTPSPTRSSGTGLATLRERLQLAFGGDVRLQLDALSPHGTRVEIDLPAQAARA